MKFFKTKEEKLQLLQEKCDYYNDLCSDFLGKFIIVNKELLVFNDFLIYKGNIVVSFKKHTTAEGISTLKSTSHSHYDGDFIIKAREEYRKFGHSLLGFGYEIVPVKQSP